jgi:hypothetical protein
MANKNEWLTLIGAHLTQLQGDERRVSDAIAANERTATALREQRTPLIKQHVERLLPGLNDLSFARLAREVPSFMTRGSIDSAIHEAGKRYRRRIDTLRTTFDPSTYEAEKRALETEIAGAEADLAIAREPYGDLLTDDDVEHLVQVNYGEESYIPRWWSSLDYYRDWKRHDLVCERYGTEDWSSIARLYNAQEDFSSALASTQKKLETLNRSQEEYADLERSLGEVPQTVCEQLRTKLRTWIDASHSLPESMSNVAELDAQISALLTANAELQGVRTTITKNIAAVRGLQGKALKSRKDQVPDAYLTAFRSRAASPTNGAATYASGMGSTTVVQQTTIYETVYIDDGYRDEMFVFFDPPPPPPASYVSSGGYGGSGGGYSRSSGSSQSYGGSSGGHDREQAYAAARADTSGQS